MVGAGTTDGATVDNGVRMLRSLTLGLLAAAACGADELFPALNLEAHGFVSFGHLQTWGNNWLGPTRDGSNEFWEGALNVIARPIDHLRLGAQVFARDLGEFDNGKAQLDWAYADWRQNDAIGVQVGRVKLPIGLYNESLDIDAARTPIFLPPAVYALRARDLFVSTDGAKIYGLLGPCEYAAYLGAKPFDHRGGFATYMSQLGLGDRIDDISADAIGGAMLHWHTPLQGLALRLTLTDLHGFTVTGTTSGATIDTAVDDYLMGIVSLAYECRDWTYACEFERLRGHGTVSIPALAQTIPLIDNSEGAYLNATWHAKPWLEWYAAAEASWADAGDPTGVHAYTGVFAIHVLPLANWSLKAEFRDVHGTMGASAVDNPAGVEKHWQVLALKTTVDF